MQIPGTPEGSSTIKGENSQNHRKKQRIKRRGKKEKAKRHCPRMGKLLQASGYEKSGNQTGPMDTKKNANGNLEKMEESTHKILLAQEIRDQ